MTLKLNPTAFDHARKLIAGGQFVFDERDAWREHVPSGEEEDAYIRRYGIAAYGSWYLGIDEEKPGDDKARFELPYGDFISIHRCGVLSAESRAGQSRHHVIENAAAHLLGMIEASQAIHQPPPAKGHSRVVSPGRP